MVRYPLCWPDGWPRTPPGLRLTDDRFRQQDGLPPWLEDATDQLLDELRRLGAQDFLVTSNAFRDGRVVRISDAEVAIYFMLENAKMVMACDRYISVEGNLRSL